MLLLSIFKEISAANNRFPQIMNPHDFTAQSTVSVTDRCVLTGGRSIFYPTLS